MRLLLLGLLTAMTPCSAALAQVGGQFDLDCTGTEVNLMEHSSTPAHIHLRVNLITGQACASDCSQRVNLQVTPSALIFPVETIADMKVTAIVDRVKGTYVIAMQGLSGALAGTILGGTTTTCERQPFSGMPAPKF